MDDLHEAIKENEELHEKIRQLEQEVFGLQEERDKAQAQAAAATAEPQAAVQATASMPATPEGPSKGLALIKDLTKTIKTDHLRNKIKQEEDIIEELRQSLGQEQALTKKLQEEKASLQQRLSAATLEASQARAEADLCRKKVKEGQEGMELERTALRREIQDLREQLEEAQFSFGAGMGASQREATSLRFTAAEDTLALQLEGLGGLEGADSGSEAGDVRPPSAGVSSKELQKLQSECASLREQLNDARKAQSECKQLRERVAAAEEKARKFQSAADEAQLSNELQVERNRLECRQLKEQLRYLENAPRSATPPPQRREASGTRGRQEAQEPQAATAGPQEPPEWLPAEEAALRECLQLRKQLASLESAQEECSQLRSKLEAAEQVRAERDQLLGQLQDSGGPALASRAPGATPAGGDRPSAAPDRPPLAGGLWPSAAPDRPPPAGGVAGAPAAGLEAPQSEPHEEGALQSQASVLREASQLRQELAAEQGRVCEQMAAAEAARRDCARLREELDAAERSASAAAAWPRDPAAVAESEKEAPDELREELETAQEAQATAARELQSHCGQLQQQLAGIKRALSESPAAAEQALHATAHRPSTHRLSLGVAQEDAQLPTPWDASHRPSRLGLGAAGEVVQPSGVWERLEWAQRDASRLRERLAAAQEAQQACARLQGQLAVAEVAQGGAEPELRQRVAALELELERAGGKRSLDRGMDSFLGSFSCFSGRSRKNSAPPSSHQDCGDEAAHPAAPTRTSVSGQGRGTRASIRRARLRDR